LAGWLGCCRHGEGRKGHVTVTTNADDLLRHIAEQNRRDRKVPRAFVRAILADDPEGLVASLEELETSLFGWRRAFQQIAKLEAVPIGMKDRMLALWCHHGDTLRGEIGHDMTLVKALRVLLPPYDGPGLTVYRGDSAWNWRRRSYGLSWSSSMEVADGHASGRLWRASTGGSVVLKVHADPAAIICAPGLIANSYGEDEYIVDRRHVRGVTVLKRYAEQPL